MKNQLLFSTLACMLCLATIQADSIVADEAATSSPSILVEAESFETHGGWKLDTQFIDTMGSPYLLAHGLGKPVQEPARRGRNCGYSRHCEYKQVNPTSPLLPY